MPDQVFNSFRTPVFSDQIPGRTVMANNREFLFFSGTSYLAINSNPDFLARLKEGLDRYGTNYSNSRNGNLQLRIFSEAEAYLAEYTGAEAAMTVSSGYLAGQLAVRSFENTGEYIYAPDTHPAVWIQNQNPSGLDFKSWVEELCNSLPKHTSNEIVIVCNSIDPLKSVHYDFSWVKELPENKSITLIIDDSHGMGITGLNGSGIYRTANQNPALKLIVVSSFGKAMGIPGGFILSDSDTIDQIRKSPFFTASSPVIPAYLHAFLHSGPIYEKARKALFKNIRQFAASVVDLKIFNSIPGYPVFYTPENGLYEFLLNRGIIISCFAYPGPEDGLITRIVINSRHTEADLIQLRDLIQEYVRNEVEGSS